MRRWTTLDRKDDKDERGRERERERERERRMGLSTVETSQSIDLSVVAHLPRSLRKVRESKLGREEVSSCLIGASH
jgi:hypothetical protein